VPIAPVEVAVVKTPRGFLVRPAYVVVTPGDRINWRNCTSGRIQILLPSGTPGAASLAYDGEGNASLRVPAGAAAGFRPYAVYSTEARDFCMGESMPGVIIKR
jgi:hypothetical protein